MATQANSANDQAVTWKIIQVLAKLTPLSDARASCFRQPPPQDLLLGASQDSSVLAVYFLLHIPLEKPGPDHNIAPYSLAPYTLDAAICDLVLTWREAARRRSLEHPNVPANTADWRLASPLRAYCGRLMYGDTCLGFRGIDDVSHLDGPLPLIADTVSSSSMPFTSRKDLLILALQELGDALPTSRHHSDIHRVDELADYLVAEQTSRVIPLSNRQKEVLRPVLRRIADSWYGVEKWRSLFGI
ncbi:hypothetical protein HK57_00615 [Aspergillus ustus]|uniref:Uncharacterized protein n=1 Tax=Aspergillus ustus TaxID=40382 RepID=A0A0C1BVR8_ASPUT|nr:hypothetical protein HK57_00615 [Aspergillus ustus]